jgi:phage gp16-like protein
MANLKAQIHIAKTQLGMDDDTYRAALKAATGKTSCKDMGVIDLNKALQAFKDRGFKSKPPKKKPSKTTATLTDKLIAQWRAMGKDGIVRDASDAALRSYVDRQTSGQFKAPQFCDNHTTIKLIESLKQWQKRVKSKTAN